MENSRFLMAVTSGTAATVLYVVLLEVLTRLMTTPGL
jgi:hypothetical protein